MNRPLCDAPKTIERCFIHSKYAILFRDVLQRTLPSTWSRHPLSPIAYSSFHGRWQNFFLNFFLEHIVLGGTRGRGKFPFCTPCRRFSQWCTPFGFLSTEFSENVSIFCRYVAFMVYSKSRFSRTVIPLNGVCDWNDFRPRWYFVHHSQTP